MKVPSSAGSPKGTESPGYLTEALGQSKHAKNLLQECVIGLLSVNEDLKQELADQGRGSRVESALRKSHVVENGVQAASTAQSLVNRALESEIRDRALVDHQLAAATEQAEAARAAATHDVLTGLPNRALLKERLEHGFGLARRHGWLTAVMFIDLDGFKGINDSYGHETGDVVLQIISRRLEEGARSEDTISRYGGDEFVYVAVDAQEEHNIVMLTKKLISAIETPCEVAIHDINTGLIVKASIGIAIFPKDGATADALVESADGAMYRAKQNRSGYAFA
jgi:diguanylate cyclase (GGDEF)-like protein